MLNMRNQLDKIIITAMDRFVWFVLLVVMSHLVTEFTRVTGYTRGSRQDVVMVNDSSIQPIRVQNLVLYPGQEYGLYEQQNQQYYNGNKHYNSYNNNHKHSSNFLSNLFNQFNNNNNQNEQEQQQQLPQPAPPAIQTANNNLLSLNSNNEQKGDVRTFNFRPLIDSIFEIPISTLRAVNNLVGRLTGSYQQPAPQEQQHQFLLPQLQQQQPTKYFNNYPSNSQSSSSSYYGMQRSAAADTQQPKTQFEMLNRLRQTTTEKAMASIAVTPNATLRKSSLDSTGGSQYEMLKSI